MNKPDASSLTLPEQPADLVIMGYVKGSFGVKGWVRLHTDTEFTDGLLEYPVWWLGKNDQWSAFTLVEGAVQAKGLVAKFEGINTPEQAAALRGSSVAISRTLLPEPDEDEFYWGDLVGLQVNNLDNQRLGQVDHLLETGANDVLVVVGDDQRQILVPFVGPIVRSVDMAQKVITVDWQLDYS
jgi:16S rRNA processing protein RimM